VPNGFPGCFDPYEHESEGRTPFFGARHSQFDKNGSTLARTLHALENMERKTSGAKQRARLDVIVRWKLLFATFECVSKARITRSLLKLRKQSASFVHDVHASFKLRIECARFATNARNLVG